MSQDTWRMILSRWMGALALVVIALALVLPPDGLGVPL